MNDINFVEVNAQKIYQELINDFESSLGEVLYPTDERRIFLQQIAQVFVGFKNEINDSARQNLLRYARDEKLNGIGEDFYNTQRLQPMKATCKGKVTLTTIQPIDIVIENGKRVTPDGILYFQVKETITIKAGQIDKEIILEATETGSNYNNFIPGQIKNIVDPIPYVKSIINIETSYGGAKIEDDEHYKQRCKLAPQSYSTAGPEGAYKYFALSADSTISDVEVLSPTPGVVKLVVLQEGGIIPEQTILDKVSNELSNKKRRPLTDNVQVVSAAAITYNINLTYYIDKEHKADELQYRKLIEGENLDFNDGAIRDYINWQQEKLGRGINPDELRYRIQNAASYNTSDNRIYTAVRRIQLNTPIFTEILNTEVAKVGTIIVNYGGLE